ncbi:hypothetical protein E4U42_005548, partial [Claviceps africana]
MRFSASAALAGIALYAVPALAGCSLDMPAGWTAKTPRKCLGTSEDNLFSCGAQTLGVSTYLTRLIQADNFNTDTVVVGSGPAMGIVLSCEYRPEVTLT